MVPWETVLIVDAIGGMVVEGIGEFVADLSVTLPGTSGAAEAALPVIGGGVTGSGAWLTRGPCLASPHVELAAVDG